MPRFVRFTKRAYFHDRIVEPGEEMLVGDDELAAHMTDLTTDEPIDMPVAGGVHRPEFIFREELSHTPGAPAPVEPMDVAAAAAATNQPLSEPAPEPETGD